MSFPITCTACHKTFTISDEIYEKKVAGRVVTIKCKSCGQGIRVDGTGKASGGAAQPEAAAAPAPAPAAPPAAAPVEPKPAAPVAAPTPAAAPVEPVTGEPLWAVDYADGQDREFTTAEVVKELERGAVNGETLVWREGMAEWLELRQVPELSAELTTLEEKKKKAAAAAAAAAAAKAAAATPVHKPRARMPTVAGIGGYKPKADAPGAAAGMTPAPEPPPAVTPKAPAAATPLPGAKAPAAATPLPGARAPATATPLPGAKTPATATPLGGAKVPAAATPLPGAKLPGAKVGGGLDLGKPRAALGSAPELGKTPQAPAAGLPKPPPAPPAPKAPPAMPAAAAAPQPPPLAAAPSPSPPAPAFETPPLRLPSPPNLPAATPPLPDSVAKVVSRPAEVPGAFPGMPSVASAASAPIVAAPFAMTPALVADHASVEWPQKSKKPLIIGGVVALVAVIAIVAFAVGGKPETPPATSIAASPPTPKTPAATPEQAPTAETPPTPQANPPSDANETGADTASGSDPIAAGNNATPGAGFAELFAAGARKAESKGGAAAPAQRFDVAATKTPLAKAATEAQSCKQSGGPTGKVTVVVTFDPSGKVASATVSEPPFAGTSTGTCIASTLKRVTIPPFSGLPGSVSKTFSIL